jgi:hypothetical protein
MASSVSSERVFSQGGITKRRDRLKSDIVEALRCVKCSIRHDFLFREPAPSSALEIELDDGGESEEEGEGVQEVTSQDEDENDEMADDESD